MNKILLTTLAIALSINIGCTQSKQVRNVSNFTAINAGGSFDVYLKKGSSEKLVIEAQSGDLDKIITEVQGGTLKIYSKNNSWNNGFRSVKIYVTFKELDEIKSSGSGNLRLQSDITANDLNISNSGSGNFNCEASLTSSGDIDISNSGSGNIRIDEIKADKLSIHNSGSGNLNINDGTTEYQSIHMSGSGNVSLEDVRSNHCKLNKSGSGTLRINVVKELTGSSSGSGNVYVKGSSARMNFSSSGSGKLKTTN